MKNRKLARRLNNIFLWIVFILITAFVLFPIYWGVRTSIAPRFDFNLIPEEVTFEHYQKILTKPEIWLYFRNSAIIVIGAIAIVLPVSMLGGYALARFKFKGDQFGILFLVLPMLPVIALLVPLIRYMNTLGMYNSLIAVVLVSAVFTMPFAIWMLKNFILGNPVSVEESALIDGCSRIGMLIRIAVPMMRPGMVAVSMFVFIQSYSTYVIAYALTSSPKHRVVPQAILAFLGSWGTDWGGLTAMGILALIPPVIFFLIFQRWFVAGMFGQQLK